jgi:hypothetical protein
MRIVGATRTRSGAIALALLWALVGGQAAAQKKAASLEPLLTVPDLTKIGLKGVVLAPPDAYDRAAQLGFLRESDQWLVLNLSRFDLNSLGGGTLRSAVGVLSTDIVAVTGVGDEAYSLLDGLFLVFRKGTATFQLSSGMDPFRDQKPFLTREQLTELAKVVCGRLGSNAEVLRGSA